MNTNTISLFYERKITKIFGINTHYRVFFFNSLTPFSGFAEKRCLAGYMFDMCG